MPNKKGGKKFKKGKKGGYIEKQLIYKDPKEDQEYGRIINACGNGRFKVHCFDGKERMGVIAGNMRKRVWVNKDDIVLISRWDFATDSDKCSIVHKYDADEAKKLQKQGQFPENIQLESDTDFAKYGEEHMTAFDYGDPSDSEDNEDNADNADNADKESSSEEEIDLDDI